MNNHTPPPLRDPRRAERGGEVERQRTKHPFLQATEAMMSALDVADGMTVYQLRCFQFNFDQFIGDMIGKAETAETAQKFPMGRHDWGKDERP